MKFKSTLYERSEDRKVMESIIQPLFVKHLKKFLIACIVLQCLCIFFLSFIYVERRQDNEKKVVELADRLVKNTENEMQNNATCMERTVEFRSDYRTMFAQDDYEIISRISELQMLYDLRGYMTDVPYNYFIYDSTIDKFIELSTVHLQFSEYRNIRETIKKHCSEDKYENGRWYRAETASETVILSGWRYKNFVLGTWALESDFLTGLNATNWGKNGKVELIEGEKKTDEKVFHTFGDSILQYSLQKSNADFYVRITISPDAGFVRQLIASLLMVFVSVGVACTLAALAGSLRRSLLIPTQNLTEILDKYQDAGDGAGITKKKKASVQDAYEILDQLGKSADRMATQLYASELEKKQLAINFRNLQIRPHFLVNCLMMLSAMAENGEAEKVNQLTVCLANYFRYIMHDCMDMVTVEQEVSHMKDVIHINDEWNNYKLEFFCDIEAGTEKCEIPVLLISTFLENSIKHAVGRDGILRIDLCVRSEKNRLCILISDNGAGFQEEFLEHFRKGDFPKEKQGKHIGINNALQRLDLIYGGRASITLSCSEIGGANVEIQIPQEGIHEAADCG